MFFPLALSFPFLQIHWVQESVAFGESHWNTEMLGWLHSASKNFSSVFILKTLAKWDFRKYKFWLKLLILFNVTFTFSEFPCSRWGSCPDFGIWWGTNIWAGHGELSVPQAQRVPQLLSAPSLGCVLPHVPHRVPELLQELTVWCGPPQDGLGEPQLMLPPSYQG